MRVDPITYSNLKTLIETTRKNGLVILNVGNNYNKVISDLVQNFNKNGIFNTEIKNPNAVFTNAYVLTSQNKKNSLILLFGDTGMFNIPALQLLKLKNTNIIYLMDFISNFESDFSESKMNNLKKIILETKVQIGRLMLEAGDIVYLPLIQEDSVSAAEKTQGEVNLELGTVPQRDARGKEIEKKDSVIPFDSKGNIITSSEVDKKDLSELLAFLRRSGYTQKVAKVFDSSVKDVQVKKNGNNLLITINPDDSTIESKSFELTDPKTIKEFNTEYGDGHDLYFTIKDLANDFPIKENKNLNEEAEEELFGAKEKDTEIKDENDISDMENLKISENVKKEILKNTFLKENFRKGLK